MPQGPGVLLGPGDDAAVVTAPDGRVVVSTDLLVEGRHFRRDWSSGYDVGRKAAAQNLADIAAMGATPTSMVVALGMPADLPLSWVDELTLGFRDECALVGASVVGGDLARSDTVVIGVTALGTLSGQAPVTRSGARPGEMVAIAGRLGHAAAGLALLESGHLPTPPTSTPTPPTSTPTPPTSTPTPPTPTPGSTPPPPTTPTPTGGPASTAPTPGPANTSPSGPTPPAAAPRDPASAPTPPPTAPTDPPTAPTDSASAHAGAPSRPTPPAAAPRDPASAHAGPPSGPTPPATAPTDPASAAPTGPASPPTDPGSSVPGVVGPGRGGVWPAGSGSRGTVSHAVVSGEALPEAGAGAAGVEGLLLEAVEGHRRPRPPYRSGPEAARLGASAMMDVSDGLLQDLGHIAKASGVRIVLDPAAFAVDEPVLAAAKELGADPLDWVLAGGEDHALVAVFPSEVRLPPEWRIVGRIEAGEGVTVTGRDDGPRGWDHFQG